MSFMAYKPLDTLHVDLNLIMDIIFEQALQQLCPK